MKLEISATRLLESLNPSAGVSASLAVCSFSVTR